MSALAVWLVKLEFGRVQTYLFAVSELKSMIGANALIGEVLRGQLVGGKFIGDRNLPALARSAGLDAALPATTLAQIAELSLEPRELPGDPLTGPSDRDNPRAAYLQGILARDGGHFQAVFATKNQADEFVRRARALVGEDLPGLSVKARPVELKWNGQCWRGPAKEEKKAETKKSPPPSKGTLLLDLPQFQVCAVTQQGAASTTVPSLDDKGEIPVSASVKKKKDQASKFDRGDTKEVLGLLRGYLLDKLGLDDDSFPNQFEHVASVSGYLAVIAADGNGIGSRSKKWRDGVSKEDDFFKREARGEQFFHAMRTTVRIALVNALVETFKVQAERLRESDKKGRLPFRLMMVGGDDLLLVCDAVYAMPFAIAYMRELEKLNLADGSPLYIGMGIAIVKKKFPFHRSHALAEELAGSAKRLYRAMPKETRGSVVDWLAISEAWHEDVAEVRRRDSLVRYTNGDRLVLSGKPYRILGEGLSLEGLHTVAQAAIKGIPETDRLARSQLMALAHKLPEGRRQGDWALRQAPDEVRTLLKPLMTGDSIWQDCGSQTWLTRLLDFLEVYELESLRHKAESEKGGQP